MLQSSGGVLTQLGGIKMSIDGGFTGKNAAFHEAIAGVEKVTASVDSQQRWTYYGHLPESDRVGPETASMQRRRALYFGGLWKGSMCGR